MKYKSIMEYFLCYNISIVKIAKFHLWNLGFKFKLSNIYFDINHHLNRLQELLKTNTLRPFLNKNSASSIKQSKHFSFLFMNRIWAYGIFDTNSDLQILKTEKKKQVAQKPNSRVIINKWQSCAAMMSWVRWWVELVVY